MLIYFTLTTCSRVGKTLKVSLRIASKAVKVALLTTATQRMINPIFQTCKRMSDHSTLIQFAMIWTIDFLMSIFLTQYDLSFNIILLITQTTSLLLYGIIILILSLIIRISSESLATLFCNLVRGMHPIDKTSATRDKRIWCLRGMIVVIETKCRLNLRHLNFGAVHVFNLGDINFNASFVLLLRNAEIL